jgi:uncharacterized membrane protein HdeD (DUF308 family)
MLTEERMVVGERARHWWVFLVTGIAWLVVAWLVLRLNETSLTTVGILLGIVFLAAGVNEAGLGSLMTGGWRVWYYVMAAIFIAAGIWALIDPIDTFFALASVLGLVLIFYGTFEIVRSIASRDMNPYWWLGLITGILLVLLAFWVSGSDRVYALEQRTFLILFWVGFFALFKGFSQIMLAFGIRHAGKEVETRLPAGSIPGGDAQGS